MENALRQLEIVVKAMTRKVLSLEEEITRVKENSEKVDEKEPFKDTRELKQHITSPTTTSSSLQHHFLSLFVYLSVATGIVLFPLNSPKQP